MYKVLDRNPCIAINLNMSKLVGGLLLFSLLCFVKFPGFISASTFFQDNFNRVDDSNLGNGWVEDAGDWTINSNRLTSIVQDDLIVHNTNQASTNDYYVQVDAKSSDAFHDNPAVLARFVDTDNYYLFQSGADRAQIYKRFGGNWTIIDDKPFTRAADTYNRYRLEVVASQIKGYIDGNLIVSGIDDSIPTSGVAGLRRGGGLFEISFDNFEVGDFTSPTPSVIPTFAPSPSPTPTPSPSPTPTPTTAPVSKVFFAPGFGGSWNADAILNCYPDPNPENWTLAPYAEEIYNPLLAAFNENGWNTKPFYYDWRQQIPDTGYVLDTYIDQHTDSNEMINLIGHSMGGLVSRAYLEQQQGHKLENLLTIGSPHKGVPFAYPAWSAGEIWNDNFLEKIATTLLIKRCGGIFGSSRQVIQNQIPSTQNFLPIFSYLKNNKTNNFVTPQIAVNNWLTYPFDLWGVRVGTINGTGLQTVQNIQIKEPSKKDVQSGNWLDGKAAGKVYSNEGDGTVLNASSSIEGAENLTINQTHSGLVSSSEGISQILDFIGSVGTNNFTTNTSNPNSALIIIGYPANFVVSSIDGKVKTSKDNMVSMLNPSTGDYKLKLLPRSKETLLIVAQFLPSGEVKYKEYKIKSFLPQFRTLKFNLENPAEDILQ